MTDPTPDDATIRRNIRPHRERRGLTQAELGGRIGVTFQQVQKYERGVNRVAASRLCLIAQALDVSVADLLDQPLNDAHPVAVMASTPSGRDMAKCWAQLPPHLQQALLQLAAFSAASIVVQRFPPIGFKDFNEVLVSEGVTL